MGLTDRITTDADVMGGRPCIRGLRVTVDTVAGLLAAGRTHAEILAAFPYLESADLTAVMALRSGYDAVANGHRLHVRDRHTLLRMAVGVLAADGVALSLEGALSGHPFPGDLHPRFEPTWTFTRNTAAPVQDLVILPLTAATARRTLRAVMPAGNLPRRVLHVLIGTADRLLFAAYDGFANPVGVTAAFPVAVLDMLVTNGTLWSYSRSPARG